MAIKNEFGGINKMEPGEHVVTIIETKVGMSRTNKPMLTVVFQNDHEQKIKGYYLRSETFSIKKLTALKQACGLKPEDPHDNLLGRRCGILVVEQKPNEEGQIFNEIAGYGKESDVEGHSSGRGSNVDEIPF